jgi:hypothetical protein
MILQLIRYDGMIYGLRLYLALFLGIFSWSLISLLLDCRVIIQAHRPGLFHVDHGEVR